nr:MAG TPA: hypothetical protein [Caudoviricetes sp.]
MHFYFTKVRLCNCNVYIFFTLWLYLLLFCKG